jgi:ketosteroid isomerase-like protein
MSRENVETVRAWVRACNEGDAEAAVALCDPSFEMTESSALPGAATTSGPDDLRRYFAGWRRNWSEWDWQEEEVQDIPPGKVLVVANLRLKGLRSGIWVERRWVYLFTLQDGKLLRQDGFEGKAEALEAARQRSGDVVRSHFRAFGSGGLAAVAEFWHPDIRWRAVEGAADDVGVIHGHDALRRYYQDWIENLDELHADVEEILFEDGDRVVAAVRNAGRGRASGVLVTGRYYVACIVRDGQIVVGREFGSAQEAIEAAQHC